MVKPVSSDQDLLILVDTSDNPLGELSKKDAHEGNGRLHRAFSVFLFNKKGEVLLQRRALDKRLWGGFWSNSVCSHPRVGEELLPAAIRRVREELAINIDTLKHVYAFVYQAPFFDVGSEYEYCHVFVGMTDQHPKPHPEEIMDWRWIAAAELKQWVSSSPELFTPWFLQEIESLTRRGMLPPVV